MNYTLDQASCPLSLSPTGSKVSSHWIQQNSPVLGHFKKVLVGDSSVVFAERRRTHKEKQACTHTLIYSVQRLNQQPTFTLILFSTLFFRELVYVHFWPSKHFLSSCKVMSLPSHHERRAETPAWSLVDWTQRQCLYRSFIILGSSRGNDGGATKSCLAPHCTPLSNYKMCFTFFPSDRWRFILKGCCHGNSSSGRLPTKDSDSMTTDSHHLLGLACALGVSDDADTRHTLRIQISTLC